MPNIFDPDEHRRAIAVEAASRCVPPAGTSTSGLLSRAQEIETYLATGLRRTGGSWTASVEVGIRNASVLVEGRELTDVEVKGIREAVAAVLS